MVEIEKIDPSSHKIWGLHRTGHNAHVLGKLLLGLSASAIIHATNLSSTELSTEAVEQNRTSAKCRDETSRTCRTSGTWALSLLPRCNRTADTASSTKPVSMGHTTRWTLARPARKTSPSTPPIAIIPLTPSTRQAKEAINDRWSSRKDGAGSTGGNIFPMAGSANPHYS